MVKLISGESAVKVARLNGLSDLSGAEITLSVLSESGFLVGDLEGQFVIRLFIKKVA